LVFPDYKIPAIVGLIDILNHVANLTAPAFAVAVLTALLARKLVFKTSDRPGFRSLALAGSAAGIVVLVAGLWLFGRDGKMSTYAAMVVACATTQWVSARAWRG
jgi:hypothetical protein